MLHHPSDSTVDQQAAAEEAFHEAQGVSSHGKKTGASKANARSRSRKKGESAAAAVRTSYKEQAAKAIARDPSPSFKPTLSSAVYPPTSPLVPPQSATLGSPNLIALGELPLEGSSDHETTKWAAQIPLGASPPVGLDASLGGESPPSKQYEHSPSQVQNSKDAVEQDVGHSNSHGPLAHDVVTQSRHPFSEEVRGGFSNASPSISPRAAYRLPVPRKNGYQSFGEYLGEGNMGKDPPNMYSQRYPYGSPIPHHLQPHPPKQPAVDPHLSQLYGDDRPLGTVTYCGFDTLANAGDVASLAVDNVLLLGYQQRLEVLKVEKEKYTRFGGLSGLRGEVLGARVLPCLSTSVKGKTTRPLIVLVIHGPADKSCLSQHSRPSSSVSQDLFDASESTILAMQEAANGPEPPVTQYQTTVEVYSLKHQQRIKALYSAKPKKIELPSKEHLMPSGTLSVQAKGKFITVSSGDSGEVYIFEQTGSADASEDITCIGKTWTSMPVRKPRSWSTPNSSEPDTTSESMQNRIIDMEAAMVSLSSRWLAIIPPLPPSRSTIHGKADRTTLRYNPPGLSSHTAPSQPSVTCEINGPVGDSTINKIARDVTQEMIRGARWVGDQGMQAFKSYWYKPTDSSPQEFSPDHENVHGPFPPTHANDGNSRPSKGPVVVSILDLQQLSDSQRTALSPQPVATFALVDGCSFLSFSPSGLALLSASVNGDVWHIWDLMRMLHGKTGITHGDLQEPENEGPSVRQIARFTRTTVAKIIDVVWTEPRGEQFALVTARGTVHIFSLPQTAFRWPPLRRVLQNPTAADRNGGEDPHTSSSDRPGAASSTFSSAMTIVSGKTQPILAAVRGRPASISNALAGFGGLNFAAGAGAKGSKVLAAGVNKGIGVAASTVDTVRRRGENRLTLPGPSSSVVLPNCIRWMNGKSRGQLAVTGGGILQIFTVNEGGSGQRRPSVLGRKPAEFKLSGSLSKAAKTGEVPEQFMPGYWPSLPDRLPTSKQSGVAHPLSFAEIETNAPYQPFHTDRRVNLHVYAEASSVPRHPGSKSRCHTPLSTHSNTMQSSSAWVFGEDIPTLQISRGSADTFSGAEEDLEVGERISRPVESQVDLSGGGLGEGGHVVVTSRRKKAKGGMASMGTEEADAEFFEDDCEVVDFAADRV